VYLAPIILVFQSEEAKTLRRSPDTRLTLRIHPTPMDIGTAIDPNSRTMVAAD
jgi:hypothetical protein